MAIQKQEFYEGAALYKLAKVGAIGEIRLDPPFYLLNNSRLVLLKYSTKPRSPWGFTFSPEEQAAIESATLRHKVIVGLICGSDGVAAITSDAFFIIANRKPVGLRIGCSRKHNEHYEVVGPDGSLARKVAPSNWQRCVQAKDTK